MRWVSALGAVERHTLLLAGALYAVVVVVLRVHHPGDIAHELALADRLLRGEPLYAGIVPAQGSLWPPFASLALVPFALLGRVSLDLAAAAWSVFGVACLVMSVTLAARWGSKPAILALLATAMPVQTNFEHRNANTVLLALIMAGAVDLTAGRDRRAGVWFGLAAGLKAFPAVLLVSLALRRRWEALAAGIAVAAIATLLPLSLYGPAGAVQALRDWLAVGLEQDQWQLARSDQSVRALALRLGASPGTAIALTLVPLALLGSVALRRRHGGADLRAVGLASLAAVLATPVAWVHYFVLAFPAWIAVTHAGVPRGSVVRLAGVWIAAVATSGWLTIGQGPLRRALLESNIYTWGGLLLLLLLATLPDAQPAVADRVPEG